MFWICFGCNGPVTRMLMSEPVDYVVGVLLCRRFRRQYCGHFWLVPATRSSLAEAAEEATPDAVLDTNDGHGIALAEIAEAAIGVVVQRADAAYVTAN